MKTARCADSTAIIAQNERIDNVGKWTLMLGKLVSHIREKLSGENKY